MTTDAGRGGSAGKARCGAVTGFSGAKLAILVGDGIVVVQRDQRAGIPWPGHWDLPGGGREGEETPLACALRETAEELSLVLDPASVRWGRAFPGVLPGQAATWFFAMRDDGLDLSRLRLGDEGRRWALMPVADYLAHPKAVPHLAERLRAYLADDAADG